MTDILVTDLEKELRRELADDDETQWEDDELLDYINEAIAFTLHKIYSNNKYGTIPEQHGKTTIPAAEFSFSNEHDLPLDFFRPIMLKVVGAAKPTRFTDLKKIDDIVTQDRAFWYGASVGAPVPGSSNGGSDSLETQGKFTGNSGVNEVITITVAAGGATFDWLSSESGSDTGVAMSTSWITLQNGIQARFGATSGFTVGDEWDINCYFDQLINIIRMNYNPSTDLELWYLERPTRFSRDGIVPETTYLPLFRYYYPIKQYSLIKARNRNEESVSQDMSIFNPVIQLILDIASDINEDDSPIIEPLYRSTDML